MKKNKDCNNIIPRNSAQIDSVLEENSRFPEKSSSKYPLSRDIPEQANEYEQSVSSCVKTPVLIGEALWDVHPDGHAEIGGAPFHIAWHLKGFGYSPLLISRIGKNESGEQILSVMKEWGMETSGIQIDKQFPTGTAKIKNIDGKFMYFLECNQAFDYLHAKPAVDVIKDRVNPILFHTLVIERSLLSRDTLKVLRMLNPGAVFLDLGMSAIPIDCGNIHDTIKQSQYIKLDRYGNVFEKKLEADWCCSTLIENAQTAVI
ncbi:hypothetical protein EH221_04685, partial [bacterium]